MTDTGKKQLQKIVEKLPLEKFIPAAFLIFLLCFIILSLITYNNIDIYKNSLTMIDHTYEVLKTSDELNMHLSAIQLKRRGYIVRQEQKYLDEYNIAKAEFYTSLNKLKFLVSDNTEQVKECLKLDSSSSVMITLLDSTLQMFKTENKVSGEQTKLALLSQDYLENCENITSGIKSKELSLLEMRQNASKNSLQNTQLFIILTSLFAFAVIGLSLFVFIRLIRNKNTTELLLRKSYDELEDRVESRTAELKNANENLVSEINNRKKIEGSLRESEERFRVMADSAPVLIWISGKDKKFTYVNKGWLDYTGRKFENEIGTGWIENIHPEELENYLSAYAANFEGRTSFEIEFRLRSSSGEYRWFLNKAIPRYKGNEFEGFIGICVDIHLKKRNERYLRIQYSVSKTLAESLTTEETLSRVLENICTGVNWKFGIAWVVNENRIYQKAFWSNNKKEITDYLSLYDKQYSLSSGEGLTGKIWKENKPYWLENITEETNVKRKDGLLKLGWNSAFGVPISDGGKVIAVIECFNHDILTAKDDLLEVLESVGRQIGNFLERKKAEENLKIAYDELETRVNERTVELANTLNRLLDEMAIKEKVQNRLKLFGHTVKSIKEGVFITDLQSKTIFVNPAFESLYGYIENEIIGEYIPVLYSKGISEETRKEIISGALKSGWKGELVNNKSDGTEFSVYLSASVIRDEEGKVDSIVGIVQDISEDIRNRELLEKRNSLLNLLNDVATGVNKIESVDKCIQFTLNKVCEYTHWDIGHYLFYDDRLLFSSGIWYENIPSKYDIFKAISEDIKIEPKFGIHREVIFERKPKWLNVNDLRDTSIYQRGDLILKIGLKTIIWIPVINRDKVIGVLEFYNKEDKILDNEILDSLFNIAMELGSFAERNDFLELIKEREKHFKAIADTANDVIVTADSNGNIIYVNSKVKDVLGYDPDELLQKSLTVIMPDKYKQQHTDAFARVLLTGEIKLIGKTIELEGRKKDGTEFPIELSLAKWELNNETFFTGMIRDISLRKGIEQELIDSRNSLLEAQTLAKMGNWEWDVKTGTVKWSEEMYSIYEDSRENFIPSFEGFISKLHNESVDEVKKHLENSLKTGMPFDFYEKILTPQGKIKILRSQGGVKYDENNNIVKLVGTCLDVTEIKEAENKIRENEEQLRLVMDNIKDYAIIHLDEKGYIKSWNKGAEQIKGYTKDEIIGKHISVFYRQKDAASGEPTENLQIAKKLGRYEKEGWRVKKDGSLFLADIIFNPLYNEKNELTGFVKVTRDITERKQAEEAVRISEMQLKEAQKIAQLGSWEWDAENNKVRWSEEMYNIFEVPPGTLITNEMYMDLLDDENKKQREIALNYALENNAPFNYFLHYKTNSGKVKILSSQGEVDLDNKGKIKRMVGTVMDVTMIKEAEDKLRESEKQLKEAQAIAKLGSWEADIKTGKISWSDEMYRIHDIEPGTESLEYENIRNYIYHKDLPQMDELFKRISKTPGNAEMDYRIVTREGRLKYLSLDLRVEIDKDGNPVRLYGSVQDITDIKLVEEELRKTNYRLIETQKELIHNEKLAALGRFSSGIAHEIRNPLANISALAQLVSKSKIEDEKMKKHLKYILVNSDIANKIIKDLLLFAAPEDLVLDTLKVSDILENTVNSFEARCEENGISVIKQISSDLPEINADKVKLENALMNFISNAIDAMSGGGKLSITANMDKIHQEVMIDIVDNGQGISPENLDKIFEPFFTTKETGTGLGLGLAYQTIKSHHGILNISSEPGNGTHVEIRLPVISKNENGKNTDN